MPLQKDQEAEKILEDYDTVLKEQIARELENMKKKVDAAQSQLTLAEMVSFIPVLDWINIHVEQYLPSTLHIV